MPSYSKNDVVLVHYPFSDLSTTKVRPAIIVHAPHPSQDCLLVPLTGRTTALTIYILNNAKDKPKVKTPSGLFLYHR